MEQEALRKMLSPTDYAEFEAALEKARLRGERRYDMARLLCGLKGEAPPPEPVERSSEFAKQFAQKFVNFEALLKAEMTARSSDKLPQVDTCQKKPNPRREK